MQLYNNDTPIKNEDKKINDKLQSLNIFIYDAISNMDKNRYIIGVEQKAKLFKSSNKYINSFINKINSLKSDEKNNGKLCFE